MGREGGAQRDADQLITAANKMLIYPGTVSMPEFKHSAIQKFGAARAQRQRRLPTKTDYSIITRTTASSLHHYYYDDDYYYYGLPVTPPTLISKKEGHHHFHNPIISLAPTL